MGLNREEKESLGGLEYKDWEDPVGSQLEVLLLDNLDLVFKSAVKEISEHGFGEEVAIKAISRRGLYAGNGDPIKNIVDEALAKLKGEKVSGSLMDDNFDDLPHLTGYTLLEMVGVLREIRPFLSVGEAMWWLLICDLNVLQACKLEEDSLSPFRGKDFLKESSFESVYSMLKSQAEDYLIETLKAGSSLKRLKLKSSNVLEEEVTNEENALMSMIGKLDRCLGGVQIGSQASEESAVVRKEQSKRELTALLQKPLNPGRPYRGHGARGSSRSGNLSNVSSVILDKRSKNLPDIHGLTVKFRSSGGKDPLAYDKHNASTNKLSTSTKARKPSRLPMKGASSSLPTAETKYLEKFYSGVNSDFNSLVNASGSAEIPDYYDGIPYDKSKGKYLPRDDKDKLILKLVPKLQELQYELHCWTEWANHKIMQATRRLTKNQLEVKRLREGTETEKQSQWEMVVKKLPGMENGLNDIIAMVESSKKFISGLEKENAILKKEAEVAKLQSLESTANYEAALGREQKALKEVQSWEGKNGALQRELELEKKKVAALQQNLDKAKNSHQQMEARCEKERKEKEKILAQAASMREKREQQEILVKEEEDSIKQKAETEKQKDMEDIRRLENKFLALKLGKSTGSFGNLLLGAEGMKKGNQNSTSLKKTMNLKGPFGNRGLRQERECVMCLSDEISVVFIPCAHQVLCGKCNELHVHRGMKDCPSCRTPILRRITARFANS